jgi:hypothetical protein
VDQERYRNRVDELEDLIGRRRSRRRRLQRGNVLDDSESYWANCNHRGERKQAQRADQDADASSLARSCPQAASISSPRE